MHKVLIKNVKEKKVKVAVIGLGYVGLPLFIEFLKSGFFTRGLDVDVSKVTTLVRKQSYITDISSEELENLHYNQLNVTNDYGDLKDHDIFIITVPTPVHKKVLPDMTLVLKSVESLLTKTLAERPSNRPFLVVLESTVYPGATRQYVYGRLRHLDKFELGKNMFIAFSPERVDPGNKHYKLRNTPKLIGGMTNECTLVAQTIYSMVTDSLVKTSSPEVAEFAKVYENCFRAVNIALVNEMTMAADSLGVDIHEVIHAASTKPFGFMPFTPGPGVGGHCIPLDPVYLSYIIRQFNGVPRLIDMALEINEKMPAFVVKKIGKILNKQNRSVKGSQIMLLGLTYKKNVNDCRESPSKVIYKLLKEEGALVSIADPYTTKEHKSDFNVVPLNHGYLRNADLVVLLVDHSSFDREFILKHAKLVLDAKNFLGEDKKVIRL